MVSEWGVVSWFKSCPTIASLYHKSTWSRRNLQICQVPGASTGHIILFNAEVVRAEHVLGELQAPYHTQLILQSCGWKMNDYCVPRNSAISLMELLQVKLGFF